MLTLETYRLVVGPILFLTLQCKDWDGVLLSTNSIVSAIMGKSQSKLPIETITELQKTTHFDKKEIQQWYLGFVAEASQQQHNAISPPSHPSISMHSTTSETEVKASGLPNIQSPTLNPSSTNLASGNGQAYWTKADLTRLYSTFFPFGNPLPFSQIMFNMYDTDRNGRIEFPEFLSALSVIARGKFDEKLAWTFRLYDLDQDGCISKNEMTIVVDALYRMLDNTVTFPEGQETPQKRVDYLFELMDKNLDGRIDFEEFCQGAKVDSLIIQSLFLYDGLL
jgi:Ca2+-binding EF-hand superfamily protein